MFFLKQNISIWWGEEVCYSLYFFCHCEIFNNRILKLLFAYFIRSLDSYSKRINRHITLKPTFPSHLLPNQKKVQLFPQHPSRGYLWSHRTLSQCTSSPLLTSFVYNFMLLPQSIVWTVILHWTSGFPPFAIANNFALKIIRMCHIRRRYWRKIS